MKQFIFLSTLTLAGAGWVPAQITAGDASRGDQLIRQWGCVTCHRGASDLGRRFARDYTPSQVVSAIWNHVPSLLEEKTPLSESQAEDLLAYFAANRYFERQGDAKRGKTAFMQDCAGCHGIRTRVDAQAPAAVEWKSLRDTIALAQVMWNHQMLQAFTRKTMRYPRMQPQELTDLLVYVENLADVRSRKPRFCLVAADTGHALYRAKGCAGCHQGKLSLENPALRHTTVDLAAGMWNHAAGAQLSYEEMCGVVSYLWSVESGGDPRRGKHLFVKKGCSNCHSGADLAGKRDEDPAALLVAFWNHGRDMREQMEKKGLRWPRLSGSELADLSGYLKTAPLHALRETDEGGGAATASLSHIHQY